MKTSVISAFLVSATLILSHAHANESVKSTDQLSAAIYKSQSWVLSTEGTTHVTSLGWFKIILEAKDDAANLIVTNGEYRGKALQQALNIIRAANPELVASDMQIAEAILKFQVPKQ